jgi:xylan 1,4-beta-xylosidase
MEPEITLSRRSLLLGAAATTTVLTVTAAPASAARGIEGQRKPDQGNGTYLNPLMAGDHPDPSILKDGEDDYLTFSSFDSYPGIVIWTSRDLVNWTPVTAALHSPIGSVWAPELVKHKVRRGWHRGSADRPHGDCRPFPLDPWPL